MKILVVGSGGREHAICFKLKQSPRVDKIYAANGNAGISSIAECVDISPEDIEGICRFAEANSIDMAVIGPEVPLAMGIVDELAKVGVKAFGVDKSCARLEASKAFTKEFLAKYNIPTAGYREFTNKEDLLANVGIYGYPMVIKADGLAAGKGVVIAENSQEAVSAIEAMMGEKIFGTAGEKVVVEEFLQGIEASMLCFVDENSIVPMESAQDYKRIFDGDKGGNTGGMGTYSPSLLFDEKVKADVMQNILLPTLRGFQNEGLKFKGVLFVGLMLGKDGAKVIEFNNRFGDPETQSVLMRLDSDLLDIMEAVVDNRLSEVEIKWKDERAVCVVLAAGGYPNAYEKGHEVFGLDDVDSDCVVFHAGTKLGAEGAVLTNGGRVLGVTALGKTHEEAREKAYANVAKISFEGMQYRKDIGKTGNL